SAGARFRLCSLCASRFRTAAQGEGDGAAREAGATPGLGLHSGTQDGGAVMDRCCVAQTSVRGVSLALAGLVVILLSLNTAVVRPADAPTAASPFHILANTAPAALNEFSRQSQLKVLFDFPRLARIQTQAVEGSYTPQEALSQMLRGTDLEF